MTLADVAYYQAYTLANVAKPLVTIGLGWLAYFVVFQRSQPQLPRQLEQLEHLIGVMSLMLILLFWTGVAWLGI